MSLMQKLTTLVRSEVRESAENIIDANAIKIFEQELLDCHDSITYAKHQLTLLMAERLRLGRKIENIIAQISAREKQTAEAVELENIELSHALAEDILNLEKILYQQKEVFLKLENREKELKKNMANKVRNICEFQRELMAVKSMQCAQSAMSNMVNVESHVSSGNLRGSLQRIHDIQQQFDDRQTASETLESELLSNGLDQQLKDAGIVSKQKDIEAILERVK